MPKGIYQHAAAPVEERFWSKVNFDGPVSGYAPELGPCWLWGAALSPNGYGVFAYAGTRTSTAQRVAFALWYGYCPPEHTDHLCRVHACVNPCHLEAVSARENSRRGVSPPAANAMKTHCPRGHQYAGENLVIRTSGRVCRICERAGQRQRYAARQADNAIPTK